MNTDRRRTNVTTMVLVAFMIIQLMLNVVFVVDRAVFRDDLNAYLNENVVEKE